MDDWHRDRSADYVRMFKDGPAHIEANRVKVPAPKWEVRGVGIKTQLTLDGSRLCTGIGPS